LIQRGTENYIELEEVGGRILVSFYNQITGGNVSLGPFMPEVIPGVLKSLLAGRFSFQINNIQFNNGLQQFHDLGFGD
jgi:hypothetical protein